VFSHHVPPAHTLNNEQEASLADITYLFEEGALVDFESDELVKLVRALFADTPLRTNTINKLVAGSPISP
jgi:protein transport protein DSL1/ZW10